MTPLLNDDGTASIATFVMSSHHAFRRDVACMIAALELPDAPLELVAAEWKNFSQSLHGHHEVEDTSMFPGLGAARPELEATIAELGAQHRLIDPLLERGDRAFAELATRRDDARAVCVEIAGLLATHLELEERTIIPHLRAAKDFSAQPGDEMVALYAEGFAWSTAGIAPHVQQQIFALLPAGVRERVPAARVAFDERCRRVWGKSHADVSTTSMPASSS